MKRPPIMKRKTNKYFIDLSDTLKIYLDSTTKYNIKARYIW